MTEQEGYPCPRCTVGRCSPQQTTFAQLHHGQLLCIPNMLAFVCDVCHLAEFEPAALERLWLELGDEPAVEDSAPVLQPKRPRSYGE